MLLTYLLQFLQDMKMLNRSAVLCRKLLAFMFGSVVATYLVFFFVAILFKNDSGAALCANEVYHYKWCDEGRCY
jgi:hypothetical protein